jgi:hypothetical protein
MILKVHYPTSLREWQSVIGLDSEHFTILLQLCEKFLEDRDGLTFEQAAAQNPNFENSRFTRLSDLIFTTLLLLKSGITFDLLGYLIGLDQPNALRQFRKGLNIVYSALEIEGYTPVRDFTDINYFHNQFVKGETLILDGTEQFIQRPSNPEKQKEFYSGKKKHHTAKTLIISTMDRYVHFVSYLYIGKSHDFSILKEEFPPEESWFDPFIVRIDLGYQGFEKEYPNVKTFIPTKKPKGGELTEEQKIRNKELAKDRIIVEHAIGGIKRFDILSNTFRIHDFEVFNEIVATCAGLWNFLITKDLQQHET